MAVTSGGRRWYRETVMNGGNSRDQRGHSVNRSAIGESAIDQAKGKRQLQAVALIVLTIEANRNSCKY